MKSLVVVGGCSLQTGRPRPACRHTDPWCSGGARTWLQAWNKTSPDTYFCQVNPVEGDCISWFNALHIFILYST